MIIFNGHELKLTTKRLLMLERKMGRNPINMFLDIDAGILPKLGDIITILHVSIGGITEDRAVEIYDEWLADGHDFSDMVPILADLFTEAGLIGGGSSEDNGPN